jgi:hypothetical protein
MRLSLTVALILSVVCEILAGLDGLGHRVLLSARSFRSADLFAGVMLLGCHRLSDRSCDVCCREAALAVAIERPLSFPPPRSAGIDPAVDLRGLLPAGFGGDACSWKYTFPISISFCRQYELGFCDEQPKPSTEPDVPSESGVDLERTFTCDPYDAPER